MKKLSTRETIELLERRKKRLTKDLDDCNIAIRTMKKLLVIEERGRVTGAPLTGWVD